MSKISLERAVSPESVGVDSREVQAYIDHCIAENKELHSIMVIRHGKVACEAYRDPYAPQFKHMMYSVSKSFTATAICFAIEEGFLTLETKFLDVFPEARREPADEYLEKLCVEDLLSMRSGFSTTPMMDKTKESWFDQVIGSKWVSEPGTEFLYISENQYLLCHMIHRLCGCSVMEFLKPRLFEPLGIENAFWETDKQGVEAGGWGMMLSTEDLGKFILMYQQMGRFNGKQIIPEWFVREATKAQADSSASKDSMDSIVGYGYCFWRCGGYENAYRADGMFSQFGICFEDLDACLVITAGEVNEQGMRDVIWPHFPKAFIDDDPNKKGVEISIPAYEKLPENPRSPLEKEIENKTIKFNKPVLVNAVGFPVSVLPLAAVFMEAEKAGNIDNLSFNFYEDEAMMTWKEGSEINSIMIGMDGEYRFDLMRLGGIDYNTAAIGTWTKENELLLQIRPLEATCERRLTFTFDGKNVVLTPGTSPTLLSMADTLKESLLSVVKPEALGEAVSKAMPYVVPIAEPKQRGIMR